MYKDFLNKTNDEVLLMYMSQGYCNNSGQGDRGVVGNLYETDEINEKITEWKNEVLENLKETKILLEEVFSEGGIHLTKWIYSKNGEMKTITNDTEENQSLMREIREKCDYDIDGYEIKDVIDFYAKATIKDNEINFSIIYDSCCQTFSKYITIKKVNKEDVRYCIIVERPVNSRESGQFILTDPYTSLEEAEKSVGDFPDETDIYRNIRKPYIIVSHINDNWLKNYLEKTNK